jgi:hypothetical protein
MHGTAGLGVMSAGIVSPATRRVNGTTYGSGDVYEALRLHNLG